MREYEIQRRSIIPRIGKRGSTSRHEAIVAAKDLSVAIQKSRKKKGIVVFIFDAGCDDNESLTTNASVGRGSLSSRRKVCLPQFFPQPYTQWPAGNQEAEKGTR